MSESGAKTMATESDVAEQDTASRVCLVPSSEPAVEAIGNGADLFGRKWNTTKFNGVVFGEAVSGLPIVFVNKGEDTRRFLNNVLRGEDGVLKQSDGGEPIIELNSINPDVDCIIAITKDTERPKFYMLVQRQEGEVPNE